MRCGNRQSGFENIGIRASVVGSGVVTPRTLKIDSCQYGIVHEPEAADFTETLEYNSFSQMATTFRL